MIDGPKRNIILGGIGYCLCMALLLFVRLLPIDGFSRWPGPDIAMCLTFVWVLRRPDQVPALLVVLIFLIEDVLLYRPPGLWPLFMLLGTEAARSREVRWRDQPFVLEWLRVSILMGAMILGYRIVQFTFLLPVPSLGQVLLQYIATVMVYPVVALAARLLIGLRRISPVEAEMMRYAR
ncbi:rod shape-determining protein MreD [Paracoccus fistulariae]|uniref:Rod shape-determining protein MreD n=1 Tax=Paracoccus fistulariae TaxID=658446 RepID=A0ABY7SIF5_9RHOB|nr:rod shape-determining protein MreD [Paracoccus fistulariae]MDB6182043.1 rod shape-determining protein MreD [Paracoccus fistulariae]WCR06723.1 rod shape-determining protein MreD [Paracoccus fistulariae]